MFPSHASFNEGSARVAVSDQAFQGGKFETIGHGIGSSLAGIGHWDDDDPVAAIATRGNVQAIDCEGDFNDDATVNIADLLELIAAWGVCGSCDEDLDNTGEVDVQDLLILIAAWGPCD